MLDGQIAQSQLEALKSYQEACWLVADRLAKAADPENARLRSRETVSISYRKIGDVLAASCPRTFDRFRSQSSRRSSRQVL